MRTDAHYLRTVNDLLGRLARLNEDPKGAAQMFRMNQCLELARPVPGDIGFILPGPSGDLRKESFLADEGLGFQTGCFSRRLNSREM